MGHKTHVDQCRANLMLAIRNGDALAIEIASEMLSEAEEMND